MELWYVVWVSPICFAHKTPNLADATLRRFCEKVEDVVFLVLTRLKSCYTYAAVVNHMIMFRFVIVRGAYAKNTVRETTLCRTESVLDISGMPT